MVSGEEADGVEVGSVGVVGFVGIVGFVGVVAFVFVLEMDEGDGDFDGNYW